MTFSLIQFADSSSGIGALGIDGKALVIQIITFLLAFWVLQRWAFKPIIKMMNQRRQIIENGVNLGQQMQKEKAELEEKVAQAISDARTQADSIVAEAHTQARTVVKAAEDEARQKAEGIIDGAKDRIEQDTARARKALEKELVGLVADTTEAVVGEKVDAAKDTQLIERALKERQHA